MVKKPEEANGPSKDRGFVFREAWGTLEVSSSSCTPNEVRYRYLRDVDIDTDVDVNVCMLVGGLK